MYLSWHTKFWLGFGPSFLTTWLLPCPLCVSDIPCFCSHLSMSPTWLPLHLSMARLRHSSWTLSAHFQPCSLGRARSFQDYLLSSQLLQWLCAWKTDCSCLTMKSSLVLSVLLRGGPGNSQFLTSTRKAGHSHFFALFTSIPYKCPVVLIWNDY
jgi:hypothetical protein